MSNEVEDKAKRHFEKFRRTLARDRIVRRIEATLPLTTDLVAIGVETDKPKYQGQGYQLIDSRDSNGIGFTSQKMDYDGRLFVTEWALAESDEVPTVKTRVIYQSGNLDLFTHDLLVAAEITDGFETPGLYSNITDERSFKTRGDYRDTLWIKGSIDNLGQNTMQFIQSFAQSARAALIK